MVMLFGLVGFLMTDGRGVVLGKVEQERLEAFLRSRQLKPEMVTLLSDVKEKNELKLGKVTTAKSAKYSKLTESAYEAMKEGWLTPETFYHLLDNSEIAGKQHVFLFQTSEEEAKKLRTRLLKPRVAIRDADVDVKQFWDIPSDSYCRVLSQSDETICVKVVWRRHFWTEREKERTEDRVLIERRRERERSAVILKVLPMVGLVQVRVPIRESKAGTDTSKTVYEFMNEIVESQYGKPGLNALNKLRPFPIGTALKALMRERESFRLIKDSPRDEKLQLTLSSIASADDAEDVRDHVSWGYDGEVWSRNSVRGYFIRGDEKIHVWLHDELVRTNSKTEKAVSRVFFSRPATDTDAEYVFAKLREFAGFNGANSPSDGD